MNKINRQDRIKRLIQSGHIGTQEEIKSQLQDYNIKVSKNMLSDLVSFSRSVLVNGVEENNNAQKQIDNLTKEILMLSINK